VLGREADAGGLANALNSDLSIEQLREAFMNSDERRNRGAQREAAIKQLYRDVLGREADAGGLANALNSDLSIEQLREAFMNSDEARKRFPNLAR
jgi:hypothetical protein